MEAVLTEAVGLLDESGEAALTFRALAARLGGGVASIYWYVQNKDELLDRAADHVMAAVLADTESFVDLDDPIEALRKLGVALYDAAIERPWLGNYFLRNTGFQPNSLRLYERVGGQVMRLHLTPRQTFHAASAVVGFVIGLAADMGQELPEEVLRGELNRDQYMARVTSQWRALDPAEYPFLNTILDEFEQHEDAEQFRAGLDLLLDGVTPTGGPDTCRSPSRWVESGVTSLS
jgi:AcrR family transcriptional regulator